MLLPTSRHLPAGLAKRWCTREELRKHTQRAVVQVSVSVSAVYYTDSSVDSDKDTTGKTVVIDGEVLSWRTPNQ